MNIVLFSDSNMFPGLLALINSIIKNKLPNYELTLHIFVENTKFKKIIECITNINTINYIINILNIEIIKNNEYTKSIYKNYININNLLSEMGENTNNYNLFNLGRLLIPELLPNIDKCMYLDSDMIVLSDLSSVYNNFIPNNKCFYAGVVNVKGKYNKKNNLFQKKYNKKEFKNTQGGIFITDLSYWKKNNILKLIENVLYDQYIELKENRNGIYSKVSFTQAVQDIVFNQYEIKLIPKLYNIIAKELDFRTPDNGGPSKEDYENGMNIGLRDNTIKKWEKYKFHDNEIKILHFKGPVKPWHKSKKNKFLKKYLSIWDKYFPKSINKVITE